ncbi:UNVERIFIED_CONTAM: hypothetical protein HDU68_008402 [Siphonaria sp. JEL0065]|nr:hypothetical protein HDU68_008402 [Siphonaria sp. JEL0065]
MIRLLTTKANNPAIIESTVKNEVSKGAEMLPEMEGEINRRVLNVDIGTIIKKIAAKVYVETEKPLTGESGLDAIEKRFLIQQNQITREHSPAFKPVLASRTRLEGPTSQFSAPAFKDNINRNHVNVVRVQLAKADATAYKTPTQLLYEDFLTIRPNMDSFDSLVEEQIAKARRKGEFDDLPGRGKPIDFNTEERLNVHLSDTEFFMNRMVKAQNALPPWIEKGKTVDQEKAMLQNELKDIYKDCFRTPSDASSPSSGTSLSFSLKALSSWISSTPEAPTLSSQRQQQPIFTESSEGAWRRKGLEWAELRIPQINKLVREYNLESPGSAAKKALLIVEDELQKASMK